MILSHLLLSLQPRPLIGHVLLSSVARDPSQPLLSVAAEPLAALDRDPEILLVWFDNTVVEPEPASAPAAAPVMAPVDATGGH